MATTTISGSTVRNNSGTVFGGGAIVGSKFRALTQTSNATGAVDKFTGIYPSWKTGVESILKGNAVAITAITQSASTGYVNIQKSTHGLSVGSLIVVYGADVTQYNTVHRVTVVTDANNVRTDVRYTSNTATHGSYKSFTGNFAKMVSRQFIGTIIGSTVAGVASSVLRIPAAHFIRFPYNPARGNRRYDITGWNYVTGAATKGGNAGVQVLYHDIAANNDSLAFEPFPSRAVPGELTYNAGGKSGAVTADYSQKNG